MDNLVYVKQHVALQLWCLLQVIIFYTGNYKELKQSGLIQVKRKFCVLTITGELTTLLLLGNINLVVQATITLETVLWCSISYLLKCFTNSRL